MRGGAIRPDRRVADLHDRLSQARSVRASVLAALCRECCSRAASVAPPPTSIAMSHIIAEPIARPRVAAETRGGRERRRWIAASGCIAALFAAVAVIYLMAPEDRVIAAPMAA